ncbi:MAG TPA: ATP-binding protein, partial [Candidatus Korarchaeota archaeon]|nr:ATP-binding protein [Candidatus Korarchaeota archaeon]
MSKETWGRIVRDYLELELPKLIERDIPFEFPEINRAIAIIGPRRAGKTYFMFQIIRNLLKSIEKEKTLYINLEDFRLESIKLKDMEFLLEIFYEIFPENARRACYFFLDEVQNLEGWEKFVRFLLDRGQKVFVTGSSSKLLSKELATVLRGRSIAIHVFPFSFKEVLRTRNIEVGKHLSTYEEAAVKNILEE